MEGFHGLWGLHGFYMYVFIRLGDKNGVYMGSGGKSFRKRKRERVSVMGRCVLHIYGFT